MTLQHLSDKASGKSVSRVVPLDIDFAYQKIGKGAFARTVSIVYSQLKYWWSYAKWNINNKIWFYKSQRELSDELGMSEKTIWRAIKRLKELGLLLVEKHHKQFWKQVYFYHLTFIPKVTGAGASLPKTKPVSTTAASIPTNRPSQHRKNDGIQHKKTNPLEDIYKRATQHGKTARGFGSSVNNTSHIHNHTDCRYCRGSGLVDNDKNIAIACDCEAGNRYRHIAPSVKEHKVLLTA